MQAEKNLLFIGNRVFWPPMGGHEVESYHYCKGLHDSYGYSIDVFIFDSKDHVDLDKKPDFINKVFLSIPIDTKEKIRNIISKSLCRKHYWPLQCSLYYSEANAKKLSLVVKRKHYDVVIVDMIRLAPYFSALHQYPANIVLDVDDTLSKRYKRQLKSLDRKTVIAGQYNDKLPAFIQKILKSTFVMKRVLNFEIPRMEHAEEYYSNQYNKIVFVSPIETDEYNKRYHCNKAVTIGMGVEYNYYSEEMRVSKSLGTASFVGNMSTAANADSVRLIINKVLPLCKNLEKLILIGKCPDSLKEEFKGNNNVEFCGMVDDLRPYVKSSMVFLSPLAYGTGIKTKILEAMAMGMPVVTNSVGAEGIPGENEKIWFVSDDYRKLAKYVDSLVCDSDKCETVGRSAQAFVKKSYQWELVYRDFEKLGV